MRSECYQQSIVATGRAPVAVDPTQAPWSIIPPVFHAFRDRGADSDGSHSGDAMMSDGVSLIFFLHVFAQILTTVVQRALWRTLDATLPISLLLYKPPGPLSRLR